MASARMLRAELPVQRKSTLKMRPISSLPGPWNSAAGGRCRIQQRFANLRLAVAAILDQVGKEGAGAFGIGGVEDRASLSLRLDETSAAENSEMRRQGARRNVEILGQVSG